MFDLFGAEMPLAVRFFLAFLIVLGLIGAAAWAVRRFGSARLGGVVRGRQPRLAVIEYTTVDARRRLLLVRRDNVEHLVMIGGPSDVVVEANIVRAMPASREPAMPRVPAPADTLSRALPEAASNGSWPLQPEPPAPPPMPSAMPSSMAPSMPPAMPPRRAPRIEPIAEEQMMAPPPHPEPPPRPQREVLNALADDLAAHAPPPPVTPLPPRNRPPSPPRMQPAEPRAEPPRMPAPQPAAEPAAVDQSLAEMAQRLEAALRKPKAADARAPIASAAPSDAEEVDEAAIAPPPPPPPSRPVRAAEARPARAEPKPKEGKALYDTLEQEMASLLGRQASKN
jgi:flagellar protein FliO/FliZ